jgi:hypothetical protein
MNVDLRIPAEAGLHITTINKGSTLAMKLKPKEGEGVLQIVELIIKAILWSQIGITTKSNHSIMKIIAKDPNIIMMSHHTEVDPLKV